VRVINSQEQLLLTELKKDGVLGHLDPSRMKPSIFFYCGDCDRSPDALAWHRRLLEKAGIDSRLHHIALNGGPLNLVHDQYPHLDPASLGDPMLSGAIQPILAQLSADNTELIRTLLNEVIRSFIFRQIRGSNELKQLGRLELLPHWPCGQGEIGWKMDLETLLHKSALATIAVRQRLAMWPETQAVRTASCLHLHKEEGMNTYHFRAMRWLESRRAAQFA
jgi:hypothetical protein